MTYEVSLTDDVAAQASSFENDTLRYWNACLAEIATDPSPRSGVYVDQIIPIRGFPMRTHIYEIREEMSISGERIFVFIAEFFPEVGIVYVADEAARTCLVIYLRADGW